MGFSITLTVALDEDRLLGETVVMIFEDCDIPSNETHDQSSKFASIIIVSAEDLTLYLVSRPLRRFCFVMSP